MIHIYSMIAADCPLCETEINILWDIKAMGSSMYCPVCGNKFKLTKNKTFPTVSELYDNGLISARLINALSRGGKLGAEFTLDEITRFTAKEVKEFKHLGQRSFIELNSLMEQYGLSFKEEKL